MRLSSFCVAFAVAAGMSCAAPAQSPNTASAQAPKPPITIDEYFNTTGIISAALAPDGAAAVIGTETPGLEKQQSFATTCGCGRRGGAEAADPLRQRRECRSGARTASGLHSSATARCPEKLPETMARPESDDAKAERHLDHSGGRRRGACHSTAKARRALRLRGRRTASAIYYSTTEPLTPEQEDAQKAEWKDVIRWREQNRGDLLLRQEVAPAIAAALAAGSGACRKGTQRTVRMMSRVLPAGAETVARSDDGIGEIAPSPDGKALAFETEPVHRRIENPGNYEIYLVGASGGDARRLTNNEALESGLRWAPDSRWLDFIVTAAAGSLEGKYRDVQGRLYRIDPATGKVELAGRFI